MRLPELEVPVVAAPMAGGPSTPALVAAVGAAGGLGFLAAGYRTGAQVAADVASLRTLSERPFGVNVFVPGPAGDPAAVAGYRARLEAFATSYGVVLGEPVWSDDDWAGTLDAVEGVPVVSFAFGCPPADAVDRLHASGSAVLVTVTSPEEARAAEACGADGLVAQGSEAGAHRGSHTDNGSGWPLLELLGSLSSPLPVWAAGGMVSSGDVADALAAGATAAILGTAFLLCPEAGTSPTHRAALVDPRFTRTVVTRAFTGRSARGLENAFIRAHGSAAPAAYPEVHALTRPLRAAAAERGDAETLHLWAGTGWQRISAVPAAEVVRRANPTQPSGRS